MYILGIESSAHTFSIAVIDAKKKKVCSNCIDAFTTSSGGMIPRVVADHHIDVCHRVLETALTQAHVTLADISLISFSRSPGIGHMLRVGSMLAQTLHLKYNIPVVGVNHSLAHLEIAGMLQKARDPLLVYASGANTQIIAYMQGKYRIFGETLDTGIGNFLDTFARELGLGFPGGPKVAQLALQATPADYIPLPYIVKGMDLSFSGILTQVVGLYKAKKYSKPALCYSVQETVFAMLTEVTERALAHTQKKSVVLGGGVACNTRLQEMMRLMTSARKVRLHVLENQFNVDNAAMIAWLGYLMRDQATTDFTIDPYERVDQVDVTWR